MTIILRPQQIAAADAVEDAFRSGVSRPLVDACVAFGKSLTMAEVARREILRGGRVIIGAHTRELVSQNAAACKMLGVPVGINAAALNERTWRAPVISAAIQSVYRHAASFGPISMLIVDEAHLIPHEENGMYRELHRALGYPRMPGFSGTVFRLQGGSLVEGEGAPFERVVYRYTIADGIRDGYLCPAFSLGADDKMDLARLKTKAGEYTTASQDAQMIAAMDNHIAQMVHHGKDRRAWLVFEASDKAATAMAARMNEWGVPTGLVLGRTKPAERADAIERFRRGALRALVNIQALTTGFDVPNVDLLVMRRATKSLGLYIQICGRLLRTIGGNIQASTAAGKSDGAVLDFAGNIDAHGPLDFIRPRETKARMAACDECGTRNAAAAARCWKCDAVMLKNCPACLVGIPKGELTCRHCGHDMRREETERKPPKLFEVPSGAALISSWKVGSEREGGWLPVRRAWKDTNDVTWIDVISDNNFPPVPVYGVLAERASEARWMRCNEPSLTALLVPNGASRTSARQVSADGSEIIVPMPVARLKFVVDNG